jgi:hypothetical protein
MSEASNRYRLLENVLLQGTAGGWLDDPKRESLLNEMDGVWWRMTEAERAAADQRPVRIASESVPLVLSTTRSGESGAPPAERSVSTAGMTVSAVAVYGRSFARYPSTDVTGGVRFRAPRQPERAG